MTDPRDPADYWAPHVRVGNVGVQPAQVCRSESASAGLELDCAGQRAKLTLGEAWNLGECIRLALTDYFRARGGDA